MKIFLRLEDRTGVLESEYRPQTTHTMEQVFNIQDNISIGKDIVEVINSMIVRFKSGIDAAMKKITCKKCGWKSKEDRNGNIVGADQHNFNSDFCAGFAICPKCKSSELTYKEK